MKWGWTITRVLKQTATADTFVRVRTSVLPALLGGTVNQLGNTVGQLGNLVRLDSQSEGRNLDQDERNLLMEPFLRSMSTCRRMEAPRKKDDVYQSVSL